MQSQPNWWARIWKALKAYEDAADYGPYDYLSERLSRVEKELQELHGIKSREESGSGGELAPSKSLHHGAASVAAGNYSQRRD